MISMRWSRSLPISELSVSSLFEKLSRNHLRDGGVKPLITPAAKIWFACQVVLL